MTPPSKEPKRPSFDLPCSLATVAACKLRSSAFKMTLMKNSLAIGDGVKKLSGDGPKPLPPEVRRSFVLLPLLLLRQPGVRPPRGRRRLSQQGGKCGRPHRYRAAFL